MECERLFDPQGCEDVKSCATYKQGWRLGTVLILRNQKDWVGGDRSNDYAPYKASSVYYVNYVDYVILTWSLRCPLWVCTENSPEKPTTPKTVSLTSSLPPKRKTLTQVSEVSR